MKRTIATDEGLFQGEWKEWMKDDPHKFYRAVHCFRFVEEYLKRRNDRAFDDSWEMMDRWAREILNKKKKGG